MAIVHAIVRTLACSAVFMLWPELSFQIQPLIVMVRYGFLIPVMERRWKIQQNPCVVCCVLCVSGLVGFAA